MSNSLHDIFGASPTTHKTKVISEVLSSSDLENFMRGLDYEKFKIAVVPVEAEGRPDLLSFMVYGTVDFWWLLCLINGISDPFLHLKAGDQIKVIDLTSIPAIMRSNTPNTFKTIQ